MAKFEVEVRLIESYYFAEIEADSESEAGEKADKILETEMGKAKYHHDSDGETKVFLI